MADNTFYYNQRLKLQREAQAAKRSTGQFMIQTGFPTQQAMDLNRSLRNQIEMRAAAAGIPVSEAYNLAKGDLTDNAVLQDIWNRIPSLTAQRTQQAQATAASPSYGKAYTYTDPGDKGYFGMKDYEELAAQGASKADLIRYAFAAPSGVGPAVAQRLGIRAYDQPVPSSLSYTDPGDQGFFGMKDFEELASQGASLQQIQDYAKKAKYGVGEEAASILGLKPVGEAGYAMAQADKIAASFEDAQKRAEESAKVQEQLRIRSQTALAANMSRANMRPNLQIAPASGTPQTAGTQAFKRRRGDTMSTTAQGLSALNIASPSTLNI